MFGERLKSGLGQAAVYAAALVVSKAMSVLMLPVFTHFLTPEDYGRLDIIQTLANLLSIVIGFGLADTLFRFAGAAKGEKERQEAAAGVFGLAVLATVICTIVTQAAAPFIADLLPGGVTVFQTRVILASLSVTGLILVPLSWMRLKDRPGVYFFGSAGRAVVQAALVALFLSLGFGVDGVLVAGFVCAMALAATMTVIQYRSTGISLSLNLLKRQGRFGSVLVVAGMATFVLDSFDRWVLAGTVGPAALADYALAGKLGIMAAFLTQPFELWWLPRRFRVLNQEGGVDKCARMTELGICVAVIAAMGLSGLGALAVTLLTPEVYNGAIVFVPALAALAALNASTTLVNTGVLSQEKTSKPIWIDGGAAVIALAAYLLLIPALGAWGAVFATIIALGFRFLAYLIAGQKQMKIPYRLSRLSLIVTVGVATCIACTLAEGVLEPMAIAGLGLCMTAVLMVLLGLVPQQFFPVFRARPLQMS